MKEIKSFDTLSVKNNNQAPAIQKKKDTGLPGNAKDSLIQRSIAEQAKSLGSSSGAVDSKTKMPTTVQAKMENSFGTDFSNITIHQGESANEMNALAYTQGNDIHFAPGQYSPESQSGQELLGHELTHVVQQRKGNVSGTRQLKGVEINDSDVLEKEADEMGNKAAQGITTIVDGRSGADTIQKQEPDVELSEWRKSGNLNGVVPVRNENTVPDKNVREDENEYKRLLDIAVALQKSQVERANSMEQNGQITDFNYWFAKVYSLVTKHEIEYITSGAFYYPSYVLHCVDYFEQLYNNNIAAFKANEKVEAHWKQAFDQAKLDKASYDFNEDLQKQPMEGPIGEPGERSARAGLQLSTETSKVMSIVHSLVQAMLAHIRYDLPRAEAWVYNTYYKNQTGSIDAFMTDFMTMGGVFDNAGREMQAVIAEKGSWMGGIMPKSAQDMSMRYIYDADMTKERADTWKRAQELSRLPETDQAPNPYTDNTRDVTKGTGSYSDWLFKINTVPSMNSTALSPVKGSKEINDMSEQDIAQLPLIERIRMIAQMLNGATTDGAEDAILKILNATQNCKPGEVVTLIDGVDPWELLADFDFSQFNLVRGFLRNYYYSNAPSVSLIRLVTTICSVVKTMGESWEGDVVLELLGLRNDRKSILEGVGKLLATKKNKGPDSLFWDAFDNLYLGVMQTEYQRFQLCLLFNIPYKKGDGQSVPRFEAPAGNKEVKEGGHEGNVVKKEVVVNGNNNSKQTGESDGQDVITIDIEKKEYTPIENGKPVTLKPLNASIKEKNGNEYVLQLQVIANDGTNILYADEFITVKATLNGDYYTTEKFSFTFPDTTGGVSTISTQGLKVKKSDVR